jgi:uncharacterized protein YcfJ
MRTTAIASAVALALGTPAAFAGGPAFEDYALVRGVTPEYQNVNVPRQECYSEFVPQSYSRGGNSIVGPLIGGVAGGLIGSRVGEGNGRVAAAAAGAAVGALVGNHLSNGDRHEEYSEREVQRCRMVDNWESRLAGYRVAYEYQGRTYSTMLPYDPGQRLTVRVSVEPAPGGPGGDRWGR